MPAIIATMTTYAFAIILIPSKNDDSRNDSQDDCRNPFFDSKQFIELACNRVGLYQIVIQSLSFLCFPLTHRRRDALL